MFKLLLSRLVKATLYVILWIFVVLRCGASPDLPNSVFMALTLNNSVLLSMSLTTQDKPAS